jgi:hypothetical protein
MFNGNIMINYLKNGNNIKNINNSNNKHIKNESNYLYFNNEYSKDLLIKRNRVNIFEEHSKLINSRKLLNSKKNKEESSKQNTFDKDIKNEKYERGIIFNNIMNHHNNNFNIINDNTSNIKKKELMYNDKKIPLNEDVKIISNEISVNKKEEKNKALINLNHQKNKNKDTKYIKYKKEIFEKVSKKLKGDKFTKKKEIVLKNMQLNEDKINRNNNKIKKKAKSQVETENNIRKLENKIKDKIKEKNNTEMNKNIDSNKKEKIIEDNKKANDKINDKENINININVQNNEENEKTKNNVKQIIKNNEINDNTNNEEINEELLMNNYNDNMKKENLNIGKENINIEEEKDKDNKKENENYLKCEKDEEIKIENKEDQLDIDTEEKIVNNIFLSYNNNNNSDDNEEEEESKLSYFDISNIKDNIQIPKEYINIIYKNLLIEEDRGVNPSPNYNKILAQKDINKQMRSILVDWIIDVHYKFGFSDETLFMTVLIIDRYISVKHISKIRFQLLGITAMLIACKHEEINLPKIDDFIYITDNAYTKDEVYIMENDILNIFNFELLYPSPIKFYECISIKFNFDKKKFLMGKYLMESFLVDLEWVKYRPSVISCSCAYIVMKFYKMENYQESYNKKYYNLNENDCDNPKYNNEYDVKECAKDICFFVDNVNKTNYLSCKNKYANENNEKISLIIEG